MKVYFGHRVFTPENPTWGSPVVAVHDLVNRATLVDRSAIAPCECRLLTVITHHSPDCIEWGYAGSGPADLALSILTDYFNESPEHVVSGLQSLWSPRSRAAALHQRFKAEFLVNEQRDEWQIRADVIDVWLAWPSNRACLERLTEEDAELARIREPDEEERGATD